MRQADIACLPMEDAEPDGGALGGKGLFRVLASN